MLYIKLFLSFLMIGFTSFGGLSMVPLINEQMTVNGWMTAQEVSDIVAIAEMTPGPLGLNCATFAGMRAGGIPGAISSTLGVIAPSLTLTLLAAIFIHRFRNNRYIEGGLYGIRPFCIGILITVAVTLSMTNYAGAFFGVSPSNIIIGLIAFALLYFFKLSIPKTIVISGILGFLSGFLPF